MNNTNKDALLINQTLAWLWIISTLIVITASAWSLVKVKFKIDRVGLGVILFYNVLFIMQSIDSIITIFYGGDTKRVPKSA
jgi:hypothetical protein